MLYVKYDQTEIYEIRVKKKKKTINNSRFIDFEIKP